MALIAAPYARQTIIQAPRIIAGRRFTPWFPQAPTATVPARL